MEETGVVLKRIVKGTGIVLAGLFVSKLLGYIYRLIVARMGVEQYGQISIALAVFGILTTISFLGLGEGITRFVSFYKGKGDQRRIKGIITSSLKISMPLSFLLGFLWFISSDWVAINLFHNSELSILFKIFAIMIPFDISRNVFITAIKAFQKVEYEALAKSFAENIAKVILTLIAVYLGFGVVGASIAYLLSMIISWGLSLYFLEKKVFPIFKTSITSIKSNKTLFTYSFPLLISSFVFLVLQWTDTLMLGNMKSASAVGIYNVALPTAYLLFLIPSAIRTLFFPILSELYAQGKKDIFKTVYIVIVKWIMALDLIIFIFLVVFSKQIIRILFGEAYIADKIFLVGYNFTASTLALIVLSSALLLGDITVPSKDVLLVLKKTKSVLLISLGMSFSNIILNYVLIPPYSIIGAAIATGIAHTLGAIAYFVISYSITKTNPLKSNCLRIAASSGIVLFLMIVFKIYLITNILSIIISAVVFFIAYLVLLLLTKSFEKDDIMILNSVKGKLGLKIDLDKLFKKFI